MASTSVGLNRDTSDKFYTRVDVAEHFIDMLLQCVELTSNDIFLEPSAGSGAFSSPLFKKFTNVLAYDIDPQDSKIITANFLELNTTYPEGTKVHTIGNPPFGRQSTLAKKFIKKSVQFSSTIAFILPRSFKKPSFSSVFPQEFHMIYSEDCPDDAFLINGTSYNVPCVFQIWVKKDHARSKEYTETPQGYSFVKQDDNPTFAIRRVGVYAGRCVSNGVDSVSPQSHYFIKINENNNIDIKRFIEAYTKVTYPTDNTVGPRSISKNEVIIKINAVMQEINNIL
jgi:predicted RNA methylase